MKELSLLMFVAACGYILNGFFNRFFPNKIRQRNFFIPSQLDYNLLWGFIFYMGFAALMLPPQYKILPLSAASVIFCLLCYYKLLHRCLSKPHKGLFLNDLQNRLQRQQKNDSLLNTPYSRKEALRTLGLPSGLENDNDLLKKHLNILKNFAQQNPNFPYLSELINQLEQALKTK